MATTEIVLPDLGSGVSDGTLVAWLIDPGDPVAADQIIAEVETDKSLIEVPTPASGVVTELRASPGARVADGDAIAVMDVDKSAAKRRADSIDPEDAADATSLSDKAALDGGPDPDEPTATGREQEPQVASGRVFAPPRVRRLARNLSVDITAVEGTGDGGAITESDVRAAAEKRSATETEQTAGPREVTGGTTVTERRDAPDSPREVSTGKPAVRRREGEAEPLAERVERDPETPQTAQSSDQSSEGKASSPPADSAPAPEPSAMALPETGSVGTQTTHHDTVDVTAMQGARRRLVAADVADGAVTDLAFVISAVATALETVPALNGPLENGEIDPHQDVNIAVAVPTEDGLVAPVVVDANDVRLPVLAREVAELLERARDGSLSPPETADGTFTVTDFGALGGTYATPSVPATGTAVLALGEIRERPRIHEGDVAARAVLPLSAAVDARVVDGAVAAQFLTEVRRYLNTPELLLIE